MRVTLGEISWNLFRNRILSVKRNRKVLKGTKWCGTIIEWNLVTAVNNG